VTPIARRHVLTSEERALLAKATQIKARQRKLAKQERPKKVAPTAAGQREPRVRNSGFLAFLRRQPCLRCGHPKSDAAHIRHAPPGSGWRYVGKAEKPNDLGRAVPLCRVCHEMQHRMNEARFWSDVLHLDPVETATRYANAYQQQGTPHA
jgi:hypothetical protein